MEGRYCIFCLALETHIKLQQDNSAKLPNPGHTCNKIIGPLHLDVLPKAEV